MVNNWIGLILGLGCVVMGQLLEGGHVDQLIVPTAALIVGGGTLGATLLASSTSEFSGAIRGLGKLFVGHKVDHEHVIKEIMGLAAVARKEGLIALEKNVKNIKNPFFANNLRNIVDGYDPHVLEELMGNRIHHAEEEGMATAKVFETAGGFAPTVGIIGAVLGLIHVMSNLSDSSKLGGGIAVAFVATVYGVSLANLVFLPIANKMKKVFKEENEEMQIIAVGLLAIQQGLNPRVIQDKMYNVIGEEAPAEGGAGAEKKAA